jgi:uncharacterized protein (DUF433 family)/DNA-binding transcriptional MerR regulator
MRPSRTGKDRAHLARPAKPIDFSVSRGVYDARRAAALAGVPVSTLHYWARTGLYVPSVSPDPRPRLWSWADLLALRAIDFFRKQKGADEPNRATIGRIRIAMRALESHGFTKEALAHVVAVSRAGVLHILTEPAAVRADATGQTVSTDMIELVRPYGGGPNLLNPRPKLRIIPGKLQGEPHIHNTRITSAAIYALHNSGYESGQICAFYPSIAKDEIAEAIELEHSLSVQAA